MTIDDKFRNEKLQYDINREAANLSALSSGKIIEQSKSAYSPIGKAFEKQTKAIEDQGEKQVKAIEDNKKQIDNKKQLDNDNN